MQQNDGLPGPARFRRPVAIEQAGSIARVEIPLLGDSHIRLRSQGRAPGLRDERASAGPFRARFPIVAARSRAINLGNNHATQSGRSPMTAIHNAIAPNTNARSLLPIGPSYRRDEPIITTTTPAISEIAASTITTPIQTASNPGIQAKGR